MNLSPKYLIKLLEQNGFIFRRSKGSHHLFLNSEKNITVTVPLHGNKTWQKELLWRYLSRQVLK